MRVSVLFLLAAAVCVGFASGTNLRAGELATVSSSLPESVVPQGRYLASKTEGKCWDDKKVKDQPKGCPKKEEEATKQLTVFLLEFFFGGFGVGYFMYGYDALGGGRIGLTIGICCIAIIAQALQLQAAEGSGSLGGVALGCGVFSCCASCGSLGWWIYVLVSIANRDLYPQDGCMFVCNM